MTEPDTARQHALEAAFRRIAATRMADMPLCNTALSVEAVGFRDWNAVRIGVLIAPWSINLVLLPIAPGSLPALAAGECESWTFPSGSYEFMGAAEPECGPFQFCSLFSPAQEFPDQAAARGVALEVMTQLLQSSRPAPQPPPQPQPLSRRALFTPPPATAAGGT